MGRRIVAAIGGNALGETLPEQRRAAEETAKVLAGLIQGGDQVVLVHGSGPQIGLISAAMTGLSRTDPDHPMAPLSVCTAMAQGYIGYDLQNALGEELLRRGLHRPVVTLLTQVEVDPADPAFDHPDKPVGTFLTQAEAQEMARRGNPVMEDAGRGWRRAVASPTPSKGWGPWWTRTSPPPCWPGSWMPRSSSSSPAWPGCPSTTEGPTSASSPT